VAKAYQGAWWNKGMVAEGVSYKKGGESKGNLTEGVKKVLAAEGHISSQNLGSSLIAEEQEKGSDWSLSRRLAGPAKVARGAVGCGFLGDNG